MNLLFWRCVLLVGEVFEGLGGRDRDRTCDLMLAKHALSQLSYTPTVVLILNHFTINELHRSNCVHQPVKGPNLKFGVNWMLQFA